MDRTWILHLLFCFSLHDLVTSQGNPLDESEDTGLKFEDGLVYPADTSTFLGEVPNKRLSKFVRIGRGLSSFVRIGRDPAAELYGIEDDVGDDLGDDGYDNDRSAFGSPIMEGPVKRLSGFVRIGRGGDAEYQEPLTDDFQKRGAFIRMGKFPSSARLRHRAGMIHSIARQPYYRRSGRIGQSSFIRIGKRDTTDALERMDKERMADIPADDYRRYLRIGKDLDDEETASNEGLYDKFDEKRLSNFVRIGRDPSDPNDDEYGQYVDWKDLQNKRYSKFVRIGKDGQEAHKRYSKFVRIGKGNLMDGEEAAKQKRMSKFVRIGKSLKNLQSSIDKRLSNFVRIGKSEPGVDKRRLSSFVRIGKNDQDMSKRRLSSFVRIGKSDSDMSKRRLSSFVRIGKSQQDESSDINKRRLSSFVRIGKSQQDDNTDINKRRLSSFVRIGKSQQDAIEDNPDKRGLRGFVRIGKSYDELESIADLVNKHDDTTESGQVDDEDKYVEIENDPGHDTESKSLDKRALSKFVRIGKSGNTNMDSGFGDVEKRRLSSFVRIGRSTDTKPDETEAATDTKESK